jgi:hypothetical protein
MDLGGSGGACDGLYGEFTVCSQWFRVSVGYPNVMHKEKTGGCACVQVCRRTCVQVRAGVRVCVGAHVCEAMQGVGGAFASMNDSRKLAQQNYRCVHM